MIQLPSHRNSIEVKDHYKELDYYAEKYGRHGYLTNGYKIIEVYQLDFSTTDYAKPFNKIPKSERNAYGKLLYAPKCIDLLCHGLQYNVPVTGDILDEKHEDFQRVTKTECIGSY